MGRIGFERVAVGVLMVMVSGGCSEEPSQSAAMPASPTAADSSSSEGSGSVGSVESDSAAVPAPSQAPAELPSPEELIAAGRATYNGNCIACHAMDPKIDGALGPAVAGASPELLEARVLRAEYPAGYTPRRETRVMIPLPHLESKLPALAAYLGSLD